MEGLSFTAGVIGNILSVFLLLAPIKTFSQIVKHKSTEQFDSFPYICMLSNSSAGLYYGLIKPELYMVAIISGIGIFIQLVYIVLFLIYAPPNIRVKTAITFGVLNVGFPVTVFLTIYYTMHGELRVEVLGVLRAGISIIMSGSPLVVAKRVITTKSVEYMPFLLSFFFFLNGVVWTCYGILVKDFSILASSGTGSVLGILQLLLYAIYWKHKSQSNNVVDEPDDGWQHKPLLNKYNQDV